MANIAQDVIAGVIVALVGGVGAVLIRWWSKSGSSSGRLLRRVAEGRSVAKALFLGGIVCMFLGFVLPSDSLGSGGLFLAMVGSLYAVVGAVYSLLQGVRSGSTQRLPDPPPASPAPVRRVPETTPTSSVPARETVGTNPAVGDTITAESGATVTLHAYESPMPPPDFAEPDPGHYFVAIDATWCASPESEHPQHFSTNWFTLQMPDYTHVRRSTLQAKEPRLDDAPPVLRGECARGWVMFQLPKGAEPKLVVFSGFVSNKTWIAKWAL